MKIQLLIMTLFSFAILSCSSGAGEDAGSQLPGGNTLPVIVGDGSGQTNPNEDLTLTWDVTAEQPSTVYIEVSYDGGLTWQLVEQNVVNEGNYSFTVPDVPGASFRVRVVGNDDVVIAESDDVSVTGDYYPVLLGGGATQPTPGEDLTLTWDVKETHPSIVDTQVSFDGGTTWSNVETGISNSGSATYSVPDQAGDRFIFQVIDPDSGVVLARSEQLTIGEEAGTSGLPGMALTSGGGTMTGGNYILHATIGEPIQGHILKDSEGNVRAQINLLGVTE